MKLTPLCISCTLARRAAEIEMTKLDNKDKLAIYRGLLDTVSLYIGPDIEVAVLETMAFRRLKSLLGGENVYEPAIREFMNVASSRAKEIEELLEGKTLEEKFITALRAATLATAYDAVGIPETILAEPPSAADLALIGSSIKIGRDDTEKLLSRLRELGEGGNNVYYLFGSVFELPYDRLLVRVLREDLGVSVVGVARGSRYRSFVVARDLEDVGVDEYLSEVVDIGSDTVTVTKEEHEHLYSQLNSAGLVVVKGAEQAVYFHNNPLETSQAFLFVTPCPVVASAFGVPRRSFNIYLVEPGGPR